MLILRIDDRLIHGQVIAGWARPLGIESIILVSDRISKDEWSCSAYRLAIPQGIEFSCVGIKECVESLNESNKKRVMIIVESVQEASDLVDEGLEVQEITIGGLGYREATRQIAPYIYLSSEDIESVVHLYQRGIKVIGKQLPNSPRIDVIKNLAGVTGVR
ncbi:MAG: PTS sugar transporter subunit IIB [candidate division WOR-3 bacterium]|nr:MAG: PTS sugar transporter subunit IIB [candidate division WOR-3 bacterium]